MTQTLAGGRRGQVTGEFPREVTWGGLVVFRNQFHLNFCSRIYLVVVPLVTIAGSALAAVSVSVHAVYERSQISSPHLIKVAMSHDTLTECQPTSRRV